jgi:hypothetical protein
MASNHDRYYALQPDSELLFKRSDYVSVSWLFLFKDFVYFTGHDFRVPSTVFIIFNDRNSLTELFIIDFIVVWGQEILTVDGIVCMKITRVYNNDFAWCRTCIRRTSRCLP